MTFSGIEPATCLLVKHSATTNCAHLKAAKMRLVEHVARKESWEINRAYGEDKEYMRGGVA